MKKLMIAAAVVCAAVISQAATVKWNTAGTKAPSDAKGTKGSANAEGAQFYVFYIDGTRYSELAAMSYADASAAIWTDFGSGSTLDAATLLANAGTDTAGNKRNAALNAWGMATLSESIADTVADTTLYRAMLITYSDGDLGDFYIANIDKVTYNGAAEYSGVNGKAGTTWAGDGSTIGSWNAVAVPEPTSGLLLLLGVAGMALRRRRA